MELSVEKNMRPDLPSAESRLRLLCRMCRSIGSSGHLPVLGRSLGPVPSAILGRIRLNLSRVIDV